MTHRGFHLIELLVALAIMAIIAAIAYPVYTRTHQRTERQGAVVALWRLANALNRYYDQHNTYQGTNPASLGINTLTQGNHYRLSIASAGMDHYTLTATPLQADDRCGTLSLTDTGAMGSTGSDTLTHCWR